MKLLGGKRSAPAVRFMFSGCSVASACWESRRTGECLTVPPFCVCLGASHAFSLGGEPASASCRVWLTGVGDWARRAGLTAVSHRRDPDIPAIAEAEDPSNSCPQGRGSASPWRAHVWGSGTDACVCVCRLVACIHHLVS